MSVPGPFWRMMWVGGYATFLIGEDRLFTFDQPDALLLVSLGIVR